MVRISLFLSLIVSVLVPCYGQGQVVSREVSSIDGLRRAATQSNQHVKIKPGVYTVKDLVADKKNVFVFSGSNNEFDFTDVHIIVPTKLLSTMSGPVHSLKVYNMTGSHIAFRNGTFENTHPPDVKAVKDFTADDFTAYNKRSDVAPPRGVAEFCIDGDNISFIGCRIIVRGSYPYGYDDDFGKGKGSLLPLKKHGGFRVMGVDNTLFDGIHLTVESFGHGIHMHGSDKTIIRNSTIDGIKRLGADILKEGAGSLPARFGYHRFKKEYMYSLTEEGIRHYPRGERLQTGKERATGTLRVENTKVINMRGGVSCVLAPNPVTVINTTVKGCSSGYTMPANSTVTGSSGDAAYGPLITCAGKSHKGGSTYEVTVLDAPSTGSHSLVDVTSSENTFNLRYSGSNPENLRPIKLEGNNSKLSNMTPYPVVLTGSNITGVSYGKVSDGGSNNKVKYINKSVNSPAYDASVPPPTLYGIAYGQHQRQILDFWKAESNKPIPLVFVIHGGGWKGGEKERVHRFVDVQALLDAGISVAAINYRLIRHAEQDGLEPPVKACLYDAARALQFVRSKAGDWNINKERIAAAGGSAGACSSLWLAFHPDLADPDSKDPVARESTRLYCAGVKEPQTSLDPKQIREWIPNCTYGGHAFGKDSFEEFLAERDSILPWIEEYSPYALVSENDPSVYLFYKNPPVFGQKVDNPVHSSNFGVKLQERCAAVGIGCEVQYPGAVDTAHETQTDYLIDKLTEF